jgi:hypothetical protein
MDLLRLLSKFINITRSTVIGNAVGSIRYSYSFKNLSEFIDLDNANQLLAQIGANVHLEESLKVALTTFVTQYQMVKQGKNPDSLMAHLKLDED